MLDLLNPVVVKVENILCRTNSIKCIGLVKTYASFCLRMKLRVEITSQTLKKVVFTNPINLLNCYQVFDRREVTDLRPISTLV